MDKWVRRISNTCRTRALDMEKVVMAARTKGSVGLSGERISVGWRDGWRLISCAPFGSASAATTPEEKRSAKTLGASFRGKKPFFSQANKEGLVADMGSDDKEVWSPPHQNQRHHNHHHQEEEEKPPRLLTLPTILTLCRVAAVPLLITTFYMNGWWATTATTSIFIAAAITDWLDGYLARKMRLGTAFGAFLDPVADKLMVAATLVLLCTKPLEISMFGQVPWLLTVPAIAIIGREITMSAVREWAASQNSKVLEAVAVNNLGKWKTATQMIALTILLATRDSSLTGPGIVVASGVLLYISAGLAVWSLVVYMRKIWRILLK